MVTSSFEKTDGTPAIVRRGPRKWAQPRLGMGFDAAIPLPSSVMHRFILAVLSLGAVALVRAADQPVSPVAPLETEFVYEAIVTIDAPVDVGAAPLGHRRYIPITGGTFTGPRISGVVLAGGADWQTDRSDGVTEVDALYSIRCDDGTVVIVHNVGVITNGGAYMRTAPRFEAPKGPHDWLNQAQFVGSVSGGPRPGTVVIRVFRVL